MIGIRSVILIILMATLIYGNGFALTFEELADSVIAVRDAQYARIDDITMGAVAFERKLDGNGKVKEELKFEKMIFVRKSGDSLELKEQYLSYYKDGKRRDDEKMTREAEKRFENKKKRGQKDVTFDITRYLWPDIRPLYEYSFDPLFDTTIGGYDCYMIDAQSREKKDTLVNCVYYIDKESFHPVRFEFSPAKLKSNLIFRMKELDMTIEYAPVVDDTWLPVRFTARGKAKAALFVGVNFEMEQLFNNLRINIGLDDNVFIETEGTQ